MEFGISDLEFICCLFNLFFYLISKSEIPNPKLKQFQIRNSKSQILNTRLLPFYDSALPHLTPEVYPEGIQILYLRLKTL